MKSSLEKFGRILTMHKSDGKEKRDHQPSAHSDELLRASKDMQDMRNCYDGLLSAAAAMTNSIYEFSESLHEMGTCLQDKTTVDIDGESGRVLSTLGNIQAELQKIADTYRSYVIVTITNPTESLLSELRKVEEMKLQCDEKREVYEYMMSQHKEKGKLRSGKDESSIAQKLQEAQDEYSEVARLCAFRVKSLKEGQCRSLLTQATRHHAAQLNFFRKGLKALEAVDLSIRIVAEKHRIDYPLSGLDDGDAGEGEGMSSHESTDDGELSFDYRQKKQGLDTSLNPMEINQGEQLFGRQAQVGSYSAPIYPEKIDSSERPMETQRSREFNSYVLPPPVDTKGPISRTLTSVPRSIQFHNLQQPLPVDHEKHERDFDNDNTSTSASTSKSRSTIKDGTGIQLPAPSCERSLHLLRDARSAFDSKVAKRQAYSGPLPPTKPLSGKIASTSGPITATELPQMHLRVPALSSSASRSVSPPLCSPKISELHELPRPPNRSFSKPAVSSGGLTGHSGPLFLKNQEISPPSISASPLPPPPLVVPRSSSISSRHPSAMALHVAKLMESPQITRGKPEEVYSPPLTPILLSKMKSPVLGAGHT